VQDASVDAVGSNFGLTIFPDRPTGWQSARRVLKDGGLLVVTAWHASSANLQWFDTLTRLLNAAKADAGEPPMPLPSSLAGSESIFDELSTAGFRDIETYQTTHTVIEDFNVLLGSILDNPVAANFLDHLPKEDVIEEITKLLRKDTDAIAKQNSPARGDDSTRAVALFNMTAVTFVASK
jgi:ubiquinone/menaquinone biosynthesis C-methylase UbiE